MRLYARLWIVNQAIYLNTKNEMRRYIIVSVLVALLGICCVTAQERALVLKEVSSDSTARIYALPEALVFSGKKKSKRLAGNGMRVAGTRTAWTPDNLGQEIGSVVETDKTFQVQEISFNVMSNGISGLKLSVNIYALNEKKMQYCNVMYTPISIDVPLCSSKKVLTVSPAKQLFLVPGRYFVAVKMADCDASVKEEWGNNDKWDNKKRYSMSKQSIHFPLYLKSSYTRKGIADELEKVPVNLGLTVKGIEYR